MIIRKYLGYLADALIFPAQNPTSQIENKIQSL